MSVGGKIACSAGDRLCLKSNGKLRVAQKRKQCESPLSTVLGDFHFLLGTFLCVYIEFSTVGVGGGR